MAGLLVGTTSPTASKHVAVAKSPLTGIFGTSIAGGSWSAKLKKSGFDGIIFQGVSPKPVYLVLDDGAAELKDASHLWGKNTFETNETIQGELDDKFGVTSIGIAGENLVKYACIVDNDERATGRCGIGAVMGSKRLKAIAVKGTKTVPVGDKEAFKESEKKHYGLINASPVKLVQEAYGTSRTIDRMNDNCALPYKNWQANSMADISKVSGVRYGEELLVGTSSCFACPVQCWRRIELKQGKYNGFKGRGPEYETIAAFASMAAINDIEAVAAVYHLCNDYGLDTLSCGSTLAFAMECYEKDIITKAETDGLDLQFGNAEAVLELIPKIARREGFGDMLAEGTRVMAKKIGKDTERFAMNVKGLELPAYECRGAKIMGLAYAVASRGGCHNNAVIQITALAKIPNNLAENSIVKRPFKANPDDVPLLKNLEDAETVVDCIGTCKFVMGFSSTYQELVTAIANITGREFTHDDFKKCGERVYNLERVFNVREGITRLLEDPLPENPKATWLTGQVAKLDPILDPYYNLRGWDKDGKPTPERLKELDLEDTIKHLN